MSETEERIERIAVLDRLERLVGLYGMQVVAEVSDVAVYDRVNAYYAPHRVVHLVELRPGERIVREEGAVAAPAPEHRCGVNGGARPVARRPLRRLRPRGALSRGGRGGGMLTFKDVLRVTRRQRVRADAPVMREQSPTAMCDGSSEIRQRKAIRWNPTRRRVEVFMWAEAAWRYDPNTRRAYVRERVTNPSGVVVGVEYADTWCEPILRWEDTMTAHTTPPARPA